MVRELGKQFTSSSVSMAETGSSGLQRTQNEIIAWNSANRMSDASCRRATFPQAGSNRFSYSDRSDGRWTHWHFEGFSRRFARETPTQGRPIHWNFQWKKNAGTKPAILSMFERKCGR